MESKPGIGRSIRTRRLLQRATRRRFAVGLDSLALDDDDDMLCERRLADLLHGGLGFDEHLFHEDIFHADGACVRFAANGASVNSRRARRLISSR